MKNKKIKIKKSWELPNLWHFEQKLRGGRVHQDKTKIIERKSKYKTDYKKEY